MAPNVRAHEGADRDHVRPARAKVVEGARDELGTETATLEPRLDLGVHEGDGIRAQPVPELADHVAVEQQLVAQLVAVVADRALRAFGTHPPTLAQAALLTRRASSARTRAISLPYSWSSPSSAPRLCRSSRTSTRPLSCRTRSSTAVKPPPRARRQFPRAAAPEPQAARGRARAARLRPAAR